MQNYSKTTVRQIFVFSINMKSVDIIDIWLLGCCTRCSCTLKKWWSQLAKITPHPPPLPQALSAYWMNEHTNNEVLVRKQNWRQIFPCRHIHVYPKSIVTYRHIFFIIQKMLNSKKKHYNFNCQQIYENYSFNIEINC